MASSTSAAIASNPWLAQTVQIESITPEIFGVSTYHLRFTDPAVQAGYRFAAGQFNMLYVPAVGEIAIGVSTAPDFTGTLAHTVRLAGHVTGALAKLGIGGTFGLRGPFGTAWPIDQHHGKDVILVAGGTGLASLRAALYELLDHRHLFNSLTLLYGGRTPDALLYQREYNDWVQRGLVLETTVDRTTTDPPRPPFPTSPVRGWEGNVGVVPQLVDRLKLSHPANTVLYCCGPEVMMRYTIRSAKSRGLKPSQIWVSLERNMQCAIGLCGHCQLGGEFICKDGPVFRFDRVETFLSVESF